MSDAGRAASDWSERLRALDPLGSYIVQAPAGSGKTELLIQRCLALLARASAPEEIAAITFTRKAASEMRQRVLDALARARGEPRPAEPHRAFTWDMARAALARDDALGWQLERNPARLRIQTIDALCASLTGQMPLLARFGAQPAETGDARALYREAARATLAQIEGGGAPGEDAARLLAHLDGNVATATGLLAALLERRDHWLRTLPLGASAAGQRERVEAALAAVRGDALAALRARIPEGDAAELVALAASGAEHLSGESTSPVLACAGLVSLPPAGESGFRSWCGIAALLLTAQGGWRQRIDATIGFPPGTGRADKAEARRRKERLAALIERLRHGGAAAPGDRDTGDGGAAIDGDAAGGSAAAGPDAGEPLREALHALRALPPAHYSDAQWEALGAIVRLLPHALAQLKVSFAARGCADFVEVAQGALAALGEPDAPTDLMLALDYRIHHILVDEFQDTSFTQFALLEKLVAGWQHGAPGEDGRTLFLVGDPMQSIFGFREAEVGLFMKARDQGVGGVWLEPITLSANFRSQAGIVEWVNRVFAQAMPRLDDISSGAVRYAPSVAVHERAAGPVTLHAFPAGDRRREAERVVALIDAARSADPPQSVAVLVRKRGNLVEIAPALRRRGIAFRAIDIEPLGERAVVRDLLALARAISHLADRIAWLAVLRAPWCGLALADLLALAGAEHGVEAGEVVETGSSGGSSGMYRVRSDPRTVWELINDRACLARLSGDGRTRIEGGAGGSGIRGVFAAALRTRQRGTLREAVEGVWLALGGPACVEDDAALEDAAVFLDALEAVESAGAITDPAALLEAIGNLYARPDPHAPPAVQLMTIHKAKGLEFDTVIVPALDEVSRSDARALFEWMELRSGEGASRLLIAPVNPTGGEHDLIYEYLRRFAKTKARHEELRLIYVAATRARHHLHLLGCVQSAAEGESPPAKPPAEGSLLARIWAAVGSGFGAALPIAGAGSGDEHTRSGRSDAPGTDRRLCRLPAQWALPEMAPPLASQRMQPAQRAAAVEFSWAGETAARVGSVVHRWLQRIAGDELRGWDHARIDALGDSFRAQLAARGLAEADLEAAAGRVAQALRNALDDPRGRWLLGPQRDARNEQRITAVIGAELHHLAIDRAFTDAGGVRWVVDYKTGAHLGGDLESFLDRERVRYAATLERYAEATGAQRCGLYFPLARGWREWTRGE